jgi:hypothetical protein
MLRDAAFYEKLAGEFEIRFLPRIHVLQSVKNKWNGGVLCYFFFLYRFY